MSKKLLNISELSNLLNLRDKNTGKPQNHVIRFWEKEFKQIRPILLSGNRRYYDEKEIEKIKYIKFLLKDKGYTLKGADRKSTRLNSSHSQQSRMPSSA